MCLPIFSLIKPDRNMCSCWSCILQQKCRVWRWLPGSNCVFYTRDQTWYDLAFFFFTLSWYDEFSLTFKNTVSPRCDSKSRGGTGVPSLKLTYPLCFWPLKNEMFIGNHGIIVSQLRSRIFLGMVRYPTRGPYATAERVSADSAQQFSEQMLTSIWSF